MTPPAEEIAALVEGLSPAERYVWSHDRFDPKGWEPPNPNSPLVCALVEKGLARRADGRCGFEAFKDSFIVPTELGLALRARLIAQQEK